jgi:ankyrin repeat protein
MADDNGLLLITAAATNDAGIAETLLAQGVDVHVDNDMPLRAAAMMGNADMVKFLVEKGANVQASGNEALLYAAKRQDDATVALLLSKGADIDDMLRTHKKEVDQYCLETLDKHQSKRLRDAFEKNFAKLRKPPKELKLPKRKRASGGKPLPPK